jgi:hypothetical protein
VANATRRNAFADVSAEGAVVTVSGLMRAHFFNNAASASSEKTRTLRAGMVHRTIAGKS